MSDHFRSFTFVDRILEDQPGSEIRGEFTVPESVEEFTYTHVAEAVGQIAGWSAMAALDFTVRPVAGLAGHIDLIAPVTPGETLELSATVNRVDEEAVAYRGEARVDGKPVLRLKHCVGPALPMVEFDDPAAVRDRYELMCAGRAETGTYPGVPAGYGPMVVDDSLDFATSSLTVPEDTTFLRDHFPRKPVFPGTLLMNEKLRLATVLYEARGGKGRIVLVTKVKFRAFMLPGETLSLRAECQQQEGDVATYRVESRNGDREVSSSRVRFDREPSLPEDSHD